MLRDEQLTGFVVISGPGPAPSSVHTGLLKEGDLEFRPCSVELVIWSLLCTDHVSHTDSSSCLHRPERYHTEITFCSDGCGVPSWKCQVYYGAAVVVRGEKEEEGRIRVSYFPRVYVGHVTFYIGFLLVEVGERSN